jgi:lipopolysaccharide export system permease protein
MHFRDKAPDGTFRDIFVNDDRDPKESMTFTAARGVLLQHAGGSYLVLQHGDLVRSDHVKGDSNVVNFETYALDLSQLGTPNAAPVYQAMERSTLFLLDPSPGDTYSQNYPQRIRAEIHERTTAPLFTLAFGLIALAFLGQPHSNRQGRAAAMATVVGICTLLRAFGFAATAVGRNLNGAVPFMYAVPLIGIAFGIYATTRGQRLRVPAFVLSAWDLLAALLRRAAGRNLALAGVTTGDAS